MVTLRKVLATTVCVNQFTQNILAINSKYYDTQFLDIDQTTYYELCYDLLTYILEDRLSSFDRFCHTVEQKRRIVLSSSKCNRTPLRL